MKHTSGPWTVCGLNIGSENNKVVASCYKDSLDSVVVRPETDGECLANARLIAAAPDLLAACQGIISLQDDDHVYEYWKNEFDALEAAIAKAQGSGVV